MAAGQVLLLALQRGQDAPVALLLLLRPPDGDHFLSWLHSVNKILQILCRADGREEVKICAPAPPVHAQQHLLASLAAICV